MRWEALFLAVTYRPHETGEFWPGSSAAFACRNGFADLLVFAKTLAMEAPKNVSTILQYWAWWYVGSSSLASATASMQLSLYDGRILGKSKEENHYQNVHAPDQAPCKSIAPRKRQN